MTRQSIHKYAMGVAAGAFVAAGLILAGCSSSATPEPSATAAPTTQPKLASTQQPIGKAELWSVTCNRCHNAWSPDQYSADQWEVLMHHMRLRATLTADEHREILQFLQAASK